MHFPEISFPMESINTISSKQIYKKCYYYDRSIPSQPQKCCRGIKMLPYEIETYINVREYRRGNRKWIIQRNWQHRYTKRRQTKQKYNTIRVGHHNSKQTQIT